MTSSSTITEADILDQIIAPDQPGPSPEFARAILELRFSDAATRKIRELLDRNHQGAITETERAELERYLRVGQFLDLMQAKARLTLHQTGRDE
ncbi:MAG: hypothetical protein ACREJB_06520 [Planctomycetaceae bacterium]